LSSHDEILKTLREAAALTPGNAPLRRHLAETLLNAGQHDEAEQEFRAVLSHQPDDTGAKLGLTGLYIAQGRFSLAGVLVEDVLRAEDAPARAHLLHAWVLARTGHPAEAKQAYRVALERDPACADASLAALLNAAPVDATPPTATPPPLPAPIGDTEFGPTPVVAREVRDTEFTPFSGDVPINFANVGGMEALKNEIRLKIIFPLTNQDLYKAYGKRAGGGILLYGPPGCGKTYLARATAGEISAQFFCIGLHEILDMYIGNSERRLHEFFEMARNNTPCVVFIDEVDALGASRSDMRTNHGRHLINQFLEELDGARSNNDGVLILAATNAPWHVDPAFRRPGRFDRIIFVPAPDLTAREGIFELMLVGKPTGSINFATLAKKSDGFSGADIKGVVDVAVETKLEEAMRSGKLVPIEERDLLAAIKRARPTTREWFATARNYALYANQGGMYDDILEHLK
jgi:transitional endoplasmic reticulum ATPase